MPPKNKPQITILKFKRSRSTYTIPLVLSNKKNLTQEYFISSLVNAINSSGGLRLVDNIDPEEDLPLPDEEGTTVNAEDISLALPKDRQNPQENNWFPVTDDEHISAVVFNDYDLVAFKFADDEDFAIEQPVYEEQQE